MVGDFMCYYAIFTIETGGELVACDWRSQIEYFVRHQTLNPSATEHSRKAGTHGAGWRLCTLTWISSCSLSYERFLFGLRPRVQILASIWGSRPIHQERRPLISSTRNVSIVLWMLTNFSFLSWINKIILIHLIKKARVTTWILNSLSYILVRIPT